MCEGHFPEEPIVPGAHVLGLMVDVAEHLAGRHQPEIHRVIFRRPIRPDTPILVRAQMRRGGMRMRVVVAGSHAWSAQAELRDTFT